MTPATLAIIAGVGLILGAVTFTVAGLYLAKRRVLFAMLRQVAGVLDQGGIVYWLDCGTLLGAFLERNIIRHDNDVDLGFLLTQYDAALALLQKRLSRWYRSRRDNTTIVVRSLLWPLVWHQIDLCAYRRANGVVETPDDRRHQGVTASGHANGHMIAPQEWIFPLGTIELRGIRFNCPCATRKYLESMYGCIGQIGVECRWDPVTKKLEGIG